MSNSIQVFNFQGDNLEVVRQGDDVFVSLRAVCDALGVASQRQATKLAKAEWATTTMMVAVGADGRDREMIGVHLASLPMWLATLSPSKVSEGARPKLVAYQKEAAGALADYFFGERRGGGPGLTAQDVGAIVREAVSEALGGQQGTPRLHGPLSNQGALRATIVWARNAAHTFAICKGRDYKWPDNAAVIGMWTAEDVAIVRTTLDLLVTAWGFEPAELYAAWTRAGWAHVDKQAKVFGIRRSGGRAHCVVIRRTGWEAAGFASCPAGDLS